jgi:hypothetical protein
MIARCALSVRRCRRVLALARTKLVASSRRAAAERRIELSA